MAKRGASDVAIKGFPSFVLAASVNPLPRPDPTCP